jgi:hypothetical protein
MKPENIVSIVLASISALVTLGTVVYVKMKSNFKDQQDTEIELLNELGSFNDPSLLIENPDQSASSQTPYVRTKVSIKFNNIEKFASETVKFENGDKKPNQVISLPNLSNRNDQFEDDHNDMSGIETHTNYDNALKANHEGDVIIGDTRKDAVTKTFETVRHMITENTKWLNSFLTFPPKREKDIESHGNKHPKNTKDPLKVVFKSDPVKNTEKAPNSFKKTFSMNDIPSVISFDSPFKDPKQDDNFHGKKELSGNMILQEVPLDHNQSEDN